MDDLGLFRRLRRGEPGEPDALCAALADLARQPLAARWPFFGLLMPLLAHARADVRAAAVRVLRQADGLGALEGLVSALDDGDPGVQTAAVESLAGATPVHPWRFAHAVFHGSPVVRGAALDADVARDARPLLFYLLEDPALAARVVERIRDRRTTLLPPAEGMALVPDLVRRGVLARADARLVLTRRAGWLAATQRAVRGREPAVLAALTTAALAGPEPPELPDALGEDPLDDVVALFDDADDGTAAAFWKPFGEALHIGDGHVARRLFASLLVVGRRTGPSLPMALGPLALAALHLPALLCARWVPLAQRRAAVALLPSIGRHLARRDPTQLVPFLYAEPFLDDAGRPELGAIAALLELGQKPWKTVVDAVGVAAVLDAAEREPARAARLFAVADDGTGVRAALLDGLDARAPGALARALAEAARVAVHTAQVVDKLDAARLVRVVKELLTRTAAPGAELEPRRVDAVLAQLTRLRPDSDAGELLRAWLVGAAPASNALGLALVGALARQLGADRFAACAAALPVAQVRRLVEALPFATTFPWAQLLTLAQALRGTPDAALSAWAEETLTPPSERARPPATPLRIEPLHGVELTTAPDAQLARVVGVCAETPHVGVAAALAGRSSGTPSVAACTALLLAHDPLRDVARELARFSSPDGREVADAAREVVRHADAALAPGLAGRAALFRWEAHARALLDALERDVGLAAAVRDAATWPAAQLGAYVVAALATWAGDAGYRDPDALGARATPELVAALVAALGASPPVAREAARALAALARAPRTATLLAQARDAVSAVLPELDDEARALLAAWVESDGLAPAPVRRRMLLPDGLLLEAVRRSVDVEWLVPLARGDTRRLVDEATVRLAELPGGPERLVDLLAQDLPPPHSEALADSVALWPDGAALARAAALVPDRTRAPGVRFRLALELAGRGHAGLADAAVAVALEPVERPFVRARDFEALRAHVSVARLATALSASAQPHAYRPAVEALLAVAETDAPGEIPREAALGALRVFLEAGTHRMGELRRRAARVLLRAGDPDALPIVLSEAVRTNGRDVLAGLTAEAGILAARALLLAGPRVAPDARVDAWCRAAGVPPEVELEVSPDLLVWARDDKLRERVARRLARPDRRAWKLREVAETFAWGIAHGRELTGRLFDVRMIGGRAWGYTRFDTNAVHVTTLPILRQVRWGRQIVEGLILHELGHHMFHRGPGAKEVWAEAARVGMHGLLNLVADEHLERNLRGIDAGYGDRLKRLVSHAFQHADKEVPVPTLLSDLGGRAFAVLTGSPLRVARDDASVSVHNGELLLAMEAAGLSFPRFVRSLRMGLGDRHGDPKVQQGLALFAARGFRASSMADLWAITLRLREIFGDEVKLVERLGAPESLEPGHPDETVHGDGISDAEVTGEVERVLDPAGRQAKSGTGPGGGRWLNAAPDEAFDPITKVVVVPHDPVAHAAIAREVARPARAMRALLERLGLRGVPERHRLTGRSFDRSSARALVLLGDPHVLVARPQRPESDLFLGLVIDCSGSMSARGNMDRAKRFATLLAEAARGLPGVTLRVFGFTDKVIYEAGTADRCAAHALAAAGGNNDAAALWHAMGVARGSRRKARMLVMISDGLPTECSVSALKAVVRRGKREGMLCAQVAVQPLSEVCFPHYVVVDDADLDAAARRFGEIAARLVRTVLAAG